MTETAKTVTFYPAEWQAVCVGSAQQLAAYFANNASLNAEQVQAVMEHTDRLRTFVQAWKASVPAQPAKPAEQPQAAAPAPNGSATTAAPKPKRKYTRRVKAEAQVAQ